MSLFPAYGLDVHASDATKEPETVARWTAAPESELLASSDSDVEPTAAAAELAARGADEVVRAARASEEDYYEDRRFDGGNLRVTTIYFPGRPQYECSRDALGVQRPVGGKRKRARRYWERADAGGAACGEQGERAAALRRALVDNPRLEPLWRQYIDYQEWIGGAAAGAAAAEEAAARLPRSRAVRARLLAALARTLTPHDFLTRLRDMLAQEKEMSVRAELWARLVAGVARAGGEGGVSGAGAVAAAAAKDLRRLPQAYPHVLYVYGSVLRAAGLWETLVQLVELQLGMHCGAALPPPADERAAEQRLLHYEEKVVNSGLPGHAVWARVERARGAAHWRPAPAGAPLADPQRAPRPADLAELLLPLADPAALLLLAAAALRSHPARDMLFNT